MSKKIIVRENWSNSFVLVGKAKINDYTFKINETSEKSSWIYNSMNFGVDVGEKNGVIYSNMMGGYSSDKNGVIYAHGKNEDGTDDFKSKVEVSWEDRFNPEILETIGDLSFITIGIEKTDKDKIFYKKFLSQYDAILYIKEHIEDGMTVCVRGTLKYSMYNDKTQVQKNITSIVLSNAEPDKFKASFVQTILLNEDSTGLKADYIDKDKGVIYVNAKVLDYMKEYKGIEVKGQFPFSKQFEFEVDLSNQSLCKTLMDKVFKVRKGVTQMTFEGEFIEGGATVQATLDDVPQDIKDLIECGVFTEEEALARCSTNGSREQRMILRKPYIKLVGEEKTPVLQKFEEKYTEDDLYLDYLYEAEQEAEELGENVDTENTESSNADDMSWLNNL